MFFSGFNKRKKASNVGGTNLDNFVTKREEVVKHAERADQKTIAQEEVLSALELQKSRKTPTKPTTATKEATLQLLKKTTRKKFGLVCEEDVVPDQLLCEECIAAYAVNYCSGCKQVLCPYCSDICHPREDVNKRHPHLVANQLRPLRASDTSSAVIEKPYPIPHTFLEEADYQTATGRDLSMPNALAINLRDNHPVRATQPFQAAKFCVDEKLVFMDPVSRQEAYGRVISEWDFRHGCPAAPSIKRGEGSVAWYMVERLGLVCDIGNIDELIKMIHAKPPPPLMPQFAEDVQSIPYREEFDHARTVNAMIEAARVVQEHGPRRHYKPEEVHVLPRGPEPSDDGSLFGRGRLGAGGAGGVGGAGGAGGPLSPGGLMRGGSPGAFSVGPDDGSVAVGSHIISHSQSQSQINPGSPGSHAHNQSQSQSLQQPAGPSAGAKAGSAAMDKDLPVLPPSARGAAFRSWHDAIHDPLEVGPGARSEDSQKQARLALLFPQNPKEARLALKKAAERQARMLAVLLLAEHDLSRPEELLQDTTAALDTSLRDRCLRRVVKRTTRRLLGRGLDCWKNQLEHLLAVKRYLMARAIQKYCRRWLCRFKLDEAQARWEAELARRWRAVHAQFRYAAAGDKTAKHLEPFPHLLFQTTTDANRYSSFLRLVGAKIWSFVDRKRRAILLRHVRKWQDGTLESMEEGALKNGHFMHETADLDRGDLTSPRELQRQALQLYNAFQRKGHRAVSSDEQQYQNVSTLDLGLTRTTGPDSKAALPPYHPSLGVSLPAALPVFMPNNADQRLFATQETRLRYGAYKAHMQGPTDDSCWCIPGRVAMGAIPWGKASRRQSTPAITALMLQGVSTFVSLMEEEEEEALCAKLGIDSIPARMKKAAVGSKFSVDQIVAECAKQIDIYETRLADIPSYAKGDPRFDDAKRDKVRCLGRIKLAKQKALNAKAQIERFPKAFDWIRVPLPAASAPGLNDVLPQLWELERRLAEGQNLFLYSREGHGRVGMVGAMLVGRLYGFKPLEALTRIQQSHDCMASEEKRPVPLSCPQLPVQRNLVTQVVAHTNKPFQGVTWRSHSDPENMTDETHRPKPGVGKGQPITHTTSSTMPEVVDPACSRQKQSIQFKILLERDVKRPPPSPPGRVHATLPEPDPAELYAGYRHEQNVVRTLPLVNREPAARPALPLLRTVRAGVALDLPPR